MDISDKNSTVIYKVLLETRHRIGTKLSNKIIDHIFSEIKMQVGNKLYDKVYNPFFLDIMSKIKAEKSL
jgi:hypothetical protein